MKRSISLVLLSFIILFFTYFFRDNSILMGLYLLFPIVFIFQGIIYSNLKKDFLVGISLSSLAFFIPINIWFSMGNCIIFLLIYITMSLISFYFKNKFAHK